MYFKRLKISELIKIHRNDKTFIYILIDRKKQLIETLRILNMKHDSISVNRKFYNSWTKKFYNS